METYFLAWIFTILLLASLFHYSHKYIRLTFEKNYEPKIIRLSLFILTWIIYIVVVSTTGMIDDFGLPPKLPIFIIIPAFLFIGILITRNETNQVLKYLPVSLLIGFQGFRIIVELIIWLAYKDGVIPIQATFEGGNYDILIGITALPLAFYTHKERLSRGLLIFWNIAGLFILANTVKIFLFSAFFPQLMGLENSIIDFSFLHPPLIFIAGLYMPIAVLFHGLSLKQLLSK